MPRQEGAAMSLEAIQRYNETLLETLGEDAGLRDLDALREGIPRAELCAWLGDFSPPEGPCWETLWENPAAGESAAWRDAPGVPVTWEGKPALLLTASEREK